jgi:hypothetical protein
LVASGIMVFSCSIMDLSITNWNWMSKWVAIQSRTYKITALSITLKHVFFHKELYVSNDCSISRNTKHHIHIANIQT